MHRGRLAEPGGIDRAASLPVKGGLRPSLRNAGAPLTACGGHPFAPPRSANRNHAEGGELEPDRLFGLRRRRWKRLDSCPSGNRGGSCPHGHSRAMSIVPASGIIRPRSMTVHSAASPGDLPVTEALPPNQPRLGDRRDPGSIQDVEPG